MPVHDKAGIHTEPVGGCTSSRQKKAMCYIFKQRRNPWFRADDLFECCSRIQEIQRK
jgi:hypothetical protein